MTRNIGLAFLFTLASVVVLFAVWFGEIRRLPESNEVALATQREFGQRNFEQYCARCHGLSGGGSNEGLIGAPVNNLLVRKGPGTEDYDAPNTGIKAKYGTLRNYVESAIASGIRGTLMPAWSVQFGGPMRPDQIEAVTEYVMSMQGVDDSGALTEAARNASSAQSTSIAASAVPPTPSGPTPTLGAGDAARGETLFKNSACAGCHSTGTNTLVGPGLAGLFEPGGPVLPQGIDYGGNLPNGKPINDENVKEWIRTGGKNKFAVAMPANGGLANPTEQQLEDLVAYMKTLKK